MGSYWWYITVVNRRDDITTEENEQILYSAAEISGSIGTEIQELPDGERMRVYYRSDEDLSYWRNRLLDALEPWPDIRIEDMGKIDNQPWSNQSEDAFPPLAVAKTLVVLAPWHRGCEPRDRIPIYINPGSAFGTGYHESTQVMLQLLEEELERAGNRDTVDAIDIGTGSGILTIAALKLGVRSVLSRDLDPSVLDEVEGNFELNKVEMDSVKLEVGNLLCGVTGTFDLLLANILLEPLLEMLPDVRSFLKPGGVALFSGMTEQERERFLSAVSDAGLLVLGEMTKEEWWGVSAQNPA